jgi:hypothetical protein
MYQPNAPLSIPTDLGHNCLSKLQKLSQPLLVHLAWQSPAGAAAIALSVQDLAVVGCHLELMQQKL